MEIPPYNNRKIKIKSRLHFGRNIKGEDERTIIHPAQVSTGLVI